MKALSFIQDSYSHYKSIEFLEVAMGRKHRSS